MRKGGQAPPRRSPRPWGYERRALGMGGLRVADSEGRGVRQGGGEGQEEVQGGEGGVGRLVNRKGVWSMAIASVCGECHAFAHAASLVKA